MGLGSGVARGGGDKGEGNSPEVGGDRGFVRVPEVGGGFKVKGEGFRV